MNQNRCSHCQAVSRAYSALRSGQKKLGVQERRVLLIAARPDATPCAAFPHTGTPASQAAFRRAVARLQGIGLIEVFPPEGRLTVAEGMLRRYRRKYLRPRRLRLTPFGDEIVAAYKDEIRSRRPIRWLTHSESARDAALERCPTCS